MRYFLAALILGITMPVFEFGLLDGAGGAISKILLVADVIIWMTFFFRQSMPYGIALIGGLIAETSSPYFFGAVILASLSVFAVSAFLSKRLLTNRSFYSYIAISIIAFAVYFLALDLFGIIGLLGDQKIMIPSIEFAAEPLFTSMAINLFVLTVLFFLTNLVTKKMHAAFIVK